MTRLHSSCDDAGQGTEHENTHEHPRCRKDEAQTTPGVLVAVAHSSHWLGSSLCGVVVVGRSVVGFGQFLCFERDGMVLRVL